MSELSIEKEALQIACGPNWDSIEQKHIVKAMRIGWFINWLEGKWEWVGIDSRKKEDEQIYQIRIGNGNKGILTHNKPTLLEALAHAVILTEEE